MGFSFKGENSRLDLFKIPFHFTFWPDKRTAEAIQDTYAVYSENYTPEKIARDEFQEVQ